MVDLIFDSGGPTSYGFDWGPMEVERMIYDAKVGRVVGINTKHRRVQVAVSPAGQSVRVWIDGVRYVPESPDG